MIAAVPPPIRRSIELPSCPNSTLGRLPTSRIRPFAGPEDTLREMADAALGDDGERSMLVRQFTSWVVSGIFPKDYNGEILAIRNVLVQHSPWLPGVPLFRYTNDARHVEVVKTPRRMLEEIYQQGTTQVDCLPEGTLLLGRDFRFIPIEAAVPGTEIWGLDGWTRIKAVAYKGQLPVSAVRMNNGSTVLATAGHRFVVWSCAKHGLDADCCYRNSCRPGRDGGSWEQVRLLDTQPKMLLASPQRIAFGDESMGPDRAYIEGLYIADGWCGALGGFNISGQDGCPKEQQKREVQQICERLGVNTSWRRKSVYVSASDEQFAERIPRMGKRAPEKRFLSINLDEAAAAESLRGVMADSGANTGAPQSRTFTTTSPMLALQVRMLHKMFGISCGYSYIENHRGLGKHPIWRLSTRSPQQHPRRSEKLLRVAEVMHELTEAPCYDIETESGYVYLPEHDVTVHNCDEIAAMAATMLLQVGREVELVALGFEPRSLSHVGVRAREPKSRRWIWIDGVAGPKERQAAQKARELLVYSLD